MSAMGSIAIFCGANPGNDPIIRQQTEILVDLLVDQQFDLIYGGGDFGLMGLIADRFLENGRRVVGVRPRRLIENENAHMGISEMVVVENMFERKARLMELSDAFIALPGGIGTLDEMVEVITHIKIGYYRKFCGALNTNSYYEGFQIMLDRMVNTGFLPEVDRQILTLAETPEQLVDHLINFNPQS
jgi:uncharacterized protein (TIGR00730 family)